VNQLTHHPQFEIDVQDLNVSPIQGPSLPKDGPIHALVGQRVRVIRGHFKGYYALVKDVSSSGVRIELEARFATGSPLQTVDQADFLIVYVSTSLLYKNVSKLWL
jgi:transcription elongation factor